MRNLTYCLEIGQGVKSLRGSDRGFDCRLTVVRPSADRRFRALKVLTVLLLILTVGVGNVFGDELTTSGGSTSTNLPIYGTWADANQHNQFVIPASELEDMQNGTITALTMYAKTATAGCAPTIIVSLANVSSSTNLSDGFYTGAKTQVWNGTFTINSSKEWVLSSITPFDYEDGNLLVDIAMTTNGSYNSSLSFEGFYVASGGRYSYNSTNNVYSYVPKMKFTYSPTLVSCPKPTLTLDEKGDKSASFSWVKGIEAQCQYLCLPAATTLTDSHWDDATLTNSTTAVITGLSSSTNYVFYIRTYCSASEQSKVVSYPFQTDCGYISTLPWNSDDAYASAPTSSLPTCWSGLYTAGYEAPYVVSTTSGIRFYGNNNKTYNDRRTVLILPKFTTDIKNLKVKITYSTTSNDAGYPGFQIGYIKADEVNDASKFHSLTSTASPFRTTSTSTFNTSDFVSLSGAEAGSHIVICFTNSTTASTSYSVTSRYGYIKQIVVEAEQDCSAPQDVVLSASTASTADFTWTANAGVDSYKYCVVAQGEAPDWSGDLSTANNSVHVEGLTPGDYTFYTMCACGDTPSDAVNFSIVSCPAVTAVTLSDKKYNAVTVNWTSGADACDVRYKAGAGEWNTDNSNIAADHLEITGLIVGTEYTFEVKSSCGAGWVAAGETYTPAYGIPTPSVSGETDAQATVSWDAVASADGYEYVVMAGSAAADWTSPVATDETSATLADLIGGSDYIVYVRSVYGANKSEAASAAFTTTTVAPSGLTKGTVTIDEATYTWSNTGSATQYQWACKASGTPEEADWSSPISVLTATATGLTSNTNYTFYVRAYYADGKTSAYVSGAFKTDCGAVSALTWTEGNCESAETPIPSCWARIVGSGYTSYPQFYNSSSSAHGGSRSIYFYGGNSGNEEYIILPPFTEATGTLTISLWYKNGSTSTSDPCLYVGYMTDPTDGESFVSKAELTRKTSYTQAEVALTGAPADARIAIKLAGGNGGSYDYSSANVDDIVLSLTPSCPKPKTLTASNVMYDGASFSWIGGEESKWVIEFSTNSADWSEAIVEEITTNPYTKTGLTTGTTYYARVKAICGEEDESDYSNVVSFTPACKTPSTPVLDAKSTNNATISWTANSGEGTWSVQYKKSTDGAWTTVSDVTDNPYTLTGLTSATTYQVKVAACNGIYTSALSFTTDCAEKTLPWNCGFEASEGYTTGTSSSAAPICWDLLNANDGSRPYFYVSSSYNKTGSNGLYLSATNARAGFVILPEFDADLTTAQIEFYHKEEDTSYSGHIQLGYLTDIDDAETFVTLHTCGTLSKTEWLYEKVDNLESIPAGARLAFRYIGASSTYYDAYIDDITVSVRPSCTAPTAVVAEATTNNSSTINWTKGDEETSWKLRYSEDGTSWTVANEGNAFTAKPFTLEGLDANTTYYVQVMAVCGLGDESSWSASGEFTTDCDAQAMRYEQTFASAGLPSCWKQNVVGDKSWGTSSSYKTSGSYSISLSVYTEAENYADLITPSIVLDEDALLTFQLWNNYASDPAVGEVYIVVGNVTNKLLDLPATSGFELQTIDLSSYTGSTAKFIFRGHGNGKTSYRYLYIDDVVVDAKPCDAPGTLAKTETFDGAVISWTQGGNDTRYEWAVVAHEASEPAEGWTLLDEDVREVTITGKTANVQYDCYVRTYCSSTKHSASQMISFTPQCLAPTALIVSNVTNNSATISWMGEAKAIRYKAAGDDWTKETISGTSYNFSGAENTTYEVQVQAICAVEEEEAWTASVEFTTWCGVKDAAELPLNITNFTAVPECWEVTFKGEYSNVAGGKICFYGTEEQMAVLPAYDIDLNKLSVTFTYSLSGTADFGYLDEPNGTFHAFASQPTSGVELDLAGEATGAKYIAIRYNGSSSMLISGVQLRKTPTCNKPTGVTAVPSVGSATISWTSDAEAWKLQYKTGSEDWTEVSVAEKPYEITGLTQGTNYKVRVQAACAGEELSDWSDEVDFTTSCSGIDAIPYYADFTETLSSCWAVFAQDESYYKPYANTAMNQLIMNGGKEGASNNVVVMPPFSADLTNAVLSFEYSCSTDANNAQLEVGYITDKADVATFTTVETLAKSSSWVEARVPATSFGGNYIAFRYAGGSSHGDLAIRNMRMINQLVLADDVNNSAAIAANNGQTLDIQIGRTITCTGYFNTICLPFSLPTLDGTPLEGAEIWAFKYAKVENEELLFRIVEASSIEAGKPYFIQFAAGDPIENPLFKNVTISATTGQHIGDASVAQLCGILQPEIFVPGDKTKLFLYNENALYWWTGDHNSQLKSFRAYFYVNTTSGANYSPIRHGMIARIIKEEQTATGVDDVQGDNVQCIKMIENDQIVIIKNGVKYNVQGQVISK